MAGLSQEELKRVSPGLKTDCLLQPCKIQRRIRSNYMGPTLEEGSGCATGDTKQSSTLGVWEEPPRAGPRLSTSQWPQVADFGQRQKSKHLALMYKIVHGEVAVTPGLLGLQRTDSKTRASDCINSANSQGGLRKWKTYSQTRPYENETIYPPSSWRPTHSPSLGVGCLYLQTPWRDELPAPYQYHLHLERPAGPKDPPIVRTHFIAVISAQGAWQ